MRKKNQINKMNSEDNKEIEMAKEIGKYLWPNESDIEATKNKKGKFTIWFTNDYPMQHGNGSSIILERTTMLAFHKLLIASQQVSLDRKERALTKEKLQLENDNELVEIGKTYLAKEFPPSMVNELEKVAFGLGTRIYDLCLGFHVNGMSIMRNKIMGRLSGLMIPAEEKYIERFQPNDGKVVESKVELQAEIDRLKEANNKKLIRLTEMAGDVMQRDSELTLYKEAAEKIAVTGQNWIDKVETGSPGKESYERFVEALKDYNQLKAKG